MYKKALDILNILENSGYKAYIIGGYVRDKLLGIESDDIDIVTSAKPSEVQKIFNIEIKDNYGSIKLKYDDYIFDITTFRKESDYQDNRRPEIVEYVSTLEEDIKRRDFTINSIAIDKEGNYVDLLNGIDDLNNKIIKCIGDPDFKLKQDALRILRALRFSCIYDFKLDSKLEEAIINNKELIKNLSFDRIRRELDIVFSTSKVNLYIDMIKYFNLYETLQIKPKNSAIVTNNYLSIWAQLEYSDNYNFSNEEKKYISDIKDVINQGINSYTVYKYDISIIKEANKIIKCNDIENLYNTLPIKTRKDIDITYDEILDIVKDKSIINKIYIDLEKQILYNKLKNKKEDIKSYLEGDNIE